MSQKIIFTDFHHADLYHSLWLLFEKRLGWKVYTLYGEEWCTNGYWKYSDRKDIMIQYLYPMGNIEYKGSDEHCSHFFPSYYCEYLFRDLYYRIMTFQEFLDTDIDIIIPTVNNHEKSFYELQQKYKPNAKLIRQTGNIFDQTDTNLYKNQLCSSLPLSKSLPDNINKVLCHEEFSTDIFNYTPGNSDNKKIKSIIHFLKGFEISKNLWYHYKSKLPEFRFFMHGSEGDDNVIQPEITGVAKAMHDSMFIWHVKPGGDGFGYNIHEAYACGRPVITRIQDYKDHLGGLLLEDGVTCIDIGSCSIDEGVAKIRHYSQPENYEKMSKAAYERFKQVVDYDKEFIDIKKFLDRLI
jgi:glycosyltransferase involved in cell wall biosynthesis